MKRVLVHGNERMSAVYIDKLDGRSVATPTASSPVNGARSNSACSARSTGTIAAEQSYMDEGVQIFELARKGCSSGSSRAKTAPAQLRIIELLLGGRRSARHLAPTYDLLAETTAMAARQEAENTANRLKSEIWLGN